MPVVREHMWRNLLSVEPGETIREVAQRMVEHNFGAVLVLDGARLVGIMTERDLMRVVARGLHVAYPHRLSLRGVDRGRSGRYPLYGRLPAGAAT